MIISKTDDLISKDLRLEPHVNGYLLEGGVEEDAEVLGDGGGGCGTHLVDDLRRVVVQELVHRFAWKRTWKSMEVGE